MDRTFLLSIILSSLIAFSLGWYFSSQVVRFPPPDQNEYYLKVNERIDTISSKPDSTSKSETTPIQTEASDFLASINTVKKQKNEHFNAVDEKAFVELETQLDRLRKENSELKSKITHMATELFQKDQLLAQHGLTPTEVKNKEALANVPEPFNRTIQSGPSSFTAKLFDEMHNQERDHVWADEMEQNIRDYFIAHELSHTVNLNGVSCVNGGCEIRLFYVERESAQPMIESIKKQQWWTFGRSSSAENFSNKHGMYFYMLALDGNVAF